MIRPELTIDDWREALQVGRPKPGGGFMAKCPAHDDNTPSLSVDPGDTREVVVQCFAGCEYDAIKAAAGLYWQHPGPNRGGARSQKSPKVYTTRAVYSGRVFEFKLPSGEIAYVQRHKGAYFRPLEGDKWAGDLEGVNPIPYNLPTLLDGVRAGETVYHVEGCKDVDTAAEWGLVATTTGGANTWRPEFAAYYAGADVVILPDNDAPGAEYARTVAEGLRGTAKSVKVVGLPGLPDGGDLTDFRDAGRTKADLLAAVEVSPEWSAIYGNSTNLTNSTNSTNSANSTNPTVSEPFTAASLLAVDLPPIEWVAEGILPEGVSLLAGKPKKGKSWMALQLCEAVARGGTTLGSLKAAKGESLYLALEDNRRRLHKRLKKILQGDTPPAGMFFHTEWERLHEGGADRLDAWLADHPDARLVVVDTLAKVRKFGSGRNVYQEDYAALESLLPIAARHSVAILVVHHLRQMPGADPQDEISGSSGLTGGVDGWMILRRTPGSKGPTLYVDGRDVEVPKEHALYWNMNSATWTIEGDAEEVRMSKERADILLTLNRSPEPMTPKEVADIMPGSKYNNVKYLMWTMLGDGQLLKDDKGKYRPANPTNPTNPAKFIQPRSNREYSDPVSGVSGVSGDGEADDYYEVEI